MLPGSVRAALNALPFQPMSQLEGQLNPSAIGKVLQVLIAKNPAATLLISDGENEKVIYFSTGGIRLYSSKGRQVSSIEEFLVRRGLLERDLLDIVRRRSQENAKEGLVEVLERLEYVSRDRFNKCVEELIYLELCDLVSWENAIFEFYPGNPPPEIFDQDHPALFAGLDVVQLADKVKGWSQEWILLRDKLYSERLCPQLVVGQDQIAGGDDVETIVRRMVHLMTGEHNLRAIAKVSGQDFQIVARAVREGMQRKWVTGTLIPQKTATTAEEVLDEIERLEEALDKAINTILIHKRIASDYERIDEKDLASEHYASIGNIHTESGQLPRAVESYRRAVQLSPQNIDAHEKLIRRLQDVGEENNALDEIFHLAKNLVSFGLLERACVTLKAVVSKVAHRFDIRYFFADVLVQLGRIQEAVTEYLGLARDKKKAGLLDGVDELYQRILALDPGNREARDNLSRERQRSTHRGLVWFHRVAAAGALLLLSGWAVMEGLARAAWGDTESAVDRALTEKSPRDAMAALRDFSERYPWTWTAARTAAWEKRAFAHGFDALDLDLDKAWELLRSGHPTRAEKLFHHVQSSALASSQMERARKGEAEADARRRDWLELQKQASRFVDAKFYDRAFPVCRRVIEDYPEGAEGLRVPFFVESTPPGAAVHLNGTRLGITPLWIIVRHGRGQSAVVERDGFERVTVGDFESRTAPRVHADLFTGAVSAR
jgi:tetratricopeptide (TPR) repeat protein